MFMKNFLIYVIIYLILMSLYAAVITVYDKARAVKHKQRIPERALLWIGLIGGAGAMLLTMKLIHHKTRVKKFVVLLPAFIVLHAILLGVLIFFAYK